MPEMKRGVVMAAKHTPGLTDRQPCGCIMRAGIESISWEPCPLHSAAPEMLSACYAFVEAWERSHQLEKTDCAIRMARIAIAKAEGRE